MAYHLSSSEILSALQKFHRTSGRLLKMIISHDGKPDKIMSRWPSDARPGELMLFEYVKRMDQRNPKKERAELPFASCQDHRGGWKTLFGGVRQFHRKWDAPEFRSGNLYRL